jgi:hypothetical protein
VIVNSVASVSSDKCVEKDLSEKADDAEERSERCLLCWEGICLSSIESGGSELSFCLRAAAMLPIFDCSIIAGDRAWTSVIWVEECVWSRAVLRVMLTLYKIRLPNRSGNETNMM